MRRLAATLGIVPLLLAGCGEASAATRSYQVTNFTALRVAGPFTVHVHTGVGTSVRATGPQEKIDLLSVEQHGDVLDIKPIRTQSWTGMVHWSKEELVIDVGVPSLAAATLAGSGDVIIDKVHGESLALGLSGSGDLGVSAADVRTLKLDATGSGDLTAIGRAGAVSASLNGSGDIHGDKLLADTANVDLIGSGDITIGARTTAAVSLAGSGDVTVSGGAHCTVTRAGSGDVRCEGGKTGDKDD